MRVLACGRNSRCESSARARSSAGSHSLPSPSSSLFTWPGVRQHVYAREELGGAGTLRIPCPCGRRSIQMKEHSDKTTTTRVMIKYAWMLNRGSGTPLALTWTIAGSFRRATPSGGGVSSVGAHIADVLDQGNDLTHQTTCTCSRYQNKTTHTAHTARARVGGQGKRRTDTGRQGAGHQANELGGEWKEGHHGRVAHNAADKDEDEQRDAVPAEGGDVRRRPAPGAPDERVLGRTFPASRREEAPSRSTEIWCPRQQQCSGRGARSLP